MKDLPYIAPGHHGDELAEEWNAYLDARLEAEPDDFGADYAWDTAVPPRETWAAEVARLNAHLLEIWGNDDDHAD